MSENCSIPQELFYLVDSVLKKQLYRIHTVTLRCILTHYSASLWNYSVKHKFMHINKWHEILKMKVLFDCSWHIHVVAVVFLHAVHIFLARSHRFISTRWGCWDPGLSRRAGANFSPYFSETVDFLHLNFDGLVKLHERKSSRNYWSLQPNC